MKTKIWKKQNSKRGCCFPRAWAGPSRGTFSEGSLCLAHCETQGRPFAGATNEAWGWVGRGEEASVSRRLVSSRGPLHCLHMSALCYQLSAKRAWPESSETAHTSRTAAAAMGSPLGGWPSHNPQNFSQLVPADPSAQPTVGQLPFPSLPSPPSPWQFRGLFVLSCLVPHC